MKLMQISLKSRKNFANLLQRLAELQLKHLKKYVELQKAVEYRILDTRKLLPDFRSSKNML
jgi:nicotinate-nucleotide pyrophosphorylase